MKRREAIKGIGLSFGALLVSSSALSILQSCTQEKGPIWEPTFFEKNQVQFLNKVTDIILPKTPDSPGATEVNVPQFIDKFINEVYEAEDQQNFTKGISNIVNTLLERTGKNDIEDLDAEDIEPMLAEVLKKTKEEDQKIWEAYEEARLNETAIDADILSYVTLNGVRGLSIYAYKNSELVGEEILYGTIVAPTLAAANKI